MAMPPVAGRMSVAALPIPSLQDQGAARSAAHRAGPRSRLLAALGRRHRRSAAGRTRSAESDEQRRLMACVRRGPDRCSHRSRSRTPLASLAPVAPAHSPPTRAPGARRPGPRRPGFRCTSAQRPCLRRGPQAPGWRTPCAGRGGRDGYRRFVVDDDSSEKSNCSIAASVCSAQ
jgi:hypothetical protein